METKIISYSNAFQFIVYNSFQFIFGNQMNTNNKIERIQYAFVWTRSIVPIDDASHRTFDMMPYIIPYALDNIVFYILWVLTDQP